VSVVNCVPIRLRGSSIAHLSDIPRTDLMRKLIERIKVDSPNPQCSSTST